MQEYTVRINSDGDRRWYKPGTRVLHRLDGPAHELADGGKAWYVDGKLHRLDGPAYEGADGSREWHVNDKRHRLDGPACEYADGSMEWFIEGAELDEEEFLARTQPAQEITIAEIEKLIGYRVKIIDRT
jgi:hypothetical protein